MKRDDRRVQPSIEALEDRTVPAGNVAAGVIGGSLIVIGDAQANDIKIQAAFGAVSITAGGTTTVNGAKSVMLYGFKGHANIQMGGGNDFLTVGPLLVPGVLKVDMGAGDDALSIVSSTVGKGASIDGGDGNDSIMVGGSIIKGNSVVSTGAGNDTANVLGSAFGRAALQGDQNDLLGISGSGFAGVSTINFKQSFKAALPTAMSKTATVAKGGTTKIDVTSDAIAGEGTINKGSISITKAPQFGTATANADGTITYVNGGTSAASDTIKFTIKNSAGALSNEGTINISVTGASTGVGALSVIVSAGASSPTKTSPIPFTATFSDDVAGFDAADILVSGGTLGAITPTNARTYAFTVTPSGQGNVSAQVKVGGASNAAGSQNAASNVASVVFDSTAPGVTLNPLPTNSSTPTLTGTITEAGAKVTVLVNNVTLNAVVNGLNWSAVVAPALAPGVYSVTATATDAAGNSSSTTNANGLIIDQTPPTTTITSTSANPTNLSSIPIEIKFSKPVTGFVVGDITVSGGTLSNFAGSGDTYTATVTPTADGTITVAVAAGVATDGSGNTNSVATSLTRLVDRAAPTVKTALSNITRSVGAANNNIILAGTFDDVNIANSSVTFKIMKGTTPVDMTVTLFDRDAPANVANFFNYLSRYEENGGILLQRLVANFVLQGGGYHFDDATNTISAHIAVDDPVRGEFSATHSNLKGTLALALSSGPNSGTSEWFFNLANNSASLDGSGNGGPFTVFGQVVAADLAKLDDLAATPVKAVTAGLPFNTVPLVDGNTLDENNILRIEEFQVNSRDGQLTYSNVSSSNPAVVTASLGGFQGNMLSLDYGTAGTSTVSFTVTDKAGNSNTMSFIVTVT